MSVTRIKVGFPVGDKLTTKMLREPILWFIVVGAFLFAAESYFTTEREVLGR